MHMKDWPSLGSLAYIVRSPAQAFPAMGANAFLRLAKRFPSPSGMRFLMRPGQILYVASIDSSYGQSRSPMRPAMCFDVNTVVS